MTMRYRRLMALAVGLGGTAPVSAPAQVLPEVAPADIGLTAAGVRSLDSLMASYTAADRFPTSVRVPVLKANREYLRALRAEEPGNLFIAGSIEFAEFVISEKLAGRLPTVALSDEAVFRLGVVQRDGRVRVYETHTDHVGGAHAFEYRAPLAVDHNAVMLFRVPRIEEALAEAEFLEALDSDGWKPLVHQTPAQFAARLRARYKDSSQIECAKIAKWILDHIDAGHFTDAQVRNAFGLTVTQWNALKAKMADLRTKYEALLAARGE